MIKKTQKKLILYLKSVDQSDEEREGDGLKYSLFI